MPPEYGIAGGRPKSCRPATGTAIDHSAAAPVPRPGRAGGTVVDRFLTPGAVIG